MKTLVFTSGDINGIGPEICIKTINQIYNPEKRKVIFICPSNVFESTSSLINPSFNYKIIRENSAAPKDLDSVTIFDIGNYKKKEGSPTKESGKSSYTALLKAYELLKMNSADAMITAPISKTAFKLAGLNYPGQTELLAKLTKSKKYLMVFLSDDLICGLVTIHEPLKNVSRLLNAAKIKQSISILAETLINDFGISLPKIAVLGLNPHAGENGNIGKEELFIIKPAVKSLKNKIADGPFVPDAFFGMQLYKSYSAVLGIYHDQVLIPFKLLNFNKGVNYTAGLPIIRTSPDHGTGYDIAGRGIANAQSMLEAVQWAEKIILNRRRKTYAR